MSNEIELRPLKYPIPPTLIGQINKCQEEMDEFIKGVLKDDIDNSIEEFHDVIQIMLNTLMLLDIPLEYVVKGQLDHFVKIENRGWKYDKGFIEKNN